MTTATKADETAERKTEVHAMTKVCIDVGAWVVEFEEEVQDDQKPGFTLRRYTDGGERVPFEIDPSSKNWSTVMSVATLRELASALTQAADVFESRIALVTQRKASLFGNVIFDEMQRVSALVAKHKAAKTAPAKKAPAKKRPYRATR